jgi:hypothetical protein
MRKKIKVVATKCCKNCGLTQDISLQSFCHNELTFEDIDYTYNCGYNEYDCKINVFELN